MTGNTATVLIGLGIIVAVLPVGLLVLFGVERNLERAYPDHPEHPVPRQQEPQKPAVIRVPSQPGSPEQAEEAGARSSTS
jgi:hypothetical protein